MSPDDLPPRRRRRPTVLALSGLAGVFSVGCEPAEPQKYPDEVQRYVTVHVVAVRRDARGLELVDWLGTSSCAELTCTQYTPPVLCELDAGPDAIAPADAAPPPDAATPADAAPPPDAATPADAVLISTDAAPAPADAVLISTDAAPAPADAVQISADAAPAPADAVLISADAAPTPADATPATPDLGVAHQPLGADADGGCVPGPLPNAGVDPNDCDAPGSACEDPASRADREETCSCSGGYVLEAQGLRIHFAGDALNATAAAGGVELHRGEAVATANGAPVPEIHATLDGVGPSGIVRIIDVQAVPVAKDDPDTYISFAGAFELATDRVVLERGLFRPEEAE